MFNCRERNLMHSTYIGYIKTKNSSKSLFKKRRVQTEQQLLVIQSTFLVELAMEFLKMHDVFYSEIIAVESSSKQALHTKNNHRTNNLTNLS